MGFGAGMAAGGFGGSTSFGTGRSSSSSSSTATKKSSYSGGAVSLLDDALASAIDPCASEPAKTYYKCPAGHCGCFCPPGSTFLAGACHPDDDIAGVSGGGASAKAAKGAISTRSSGGDAEAKAAKRASTSGTTPSINRGTAVKSDPQVKSKTPQLGNRDNVPEKQFEVVIPDEWNQPPELLEPKDVTGRPDQKVRRFTIPESSAKIDQKAYNGLYERYRKDRLANGGTEIRKDKYEVIYSNNEATMLTSQFGCIIHPRRHQTIINTAFMTFAEQMLSTRVRSVESFSHIKNRPLNNSEIVATNLSDAAASIVANSVGEARKLAELNAYGVFGRPKRIPTRAFRSSAIDPFSALSSTPATILNMAASSKLDLFKYGQGPQTRLIAAKTKLTAAPGGFKVGPDGFRMGAQMGAPGLKMPGRGQGSQSAFTKMLGQGMSVKKAAPQASRMSSFTLRGAPMASQRSVMMTGGSSMKISKSPVVGNLQKSAAQGFSGLTQKSNMFKIQAGSRSSVSRSIGAPQMMKSQKAQAVSNSSMRIRQGSISKSDNYMKSMYTKGGKY
tara:strand:+ start:12948 stop:14621 length:1674 start_codon:yes stop_codon:yes gene_type:complete